MLSTPGFGAMATVSLALTNVSKRYPGVQALNRVSFECRPGEIHAVLGENGSGKSTLLGVASGATLADEGEVMIMGEALTSADPLLARRLGLASVYQDDSLVREFTVAENLLLGAVDGPVSLSGKRAWAAARLAAYDLEISPDAFVGSLNPTQRQFLEIVKALAANPSVLLLDEPTSTLDFSGVEKLSGIVEQIAAAGAAVVYVSHRLPEILALADRVTILRDGEGQGTYDVDGYLSENDLIALMTGRPIESGYPARRRVLDDDVVLSAERFSGPRFRDVALQVHRGEILGFAGAEGNGQREALRALGRLVESSGVAICRGRLVASGGPRQALAAGILSLSADRANESIFPPLGLRENMTVQALPDFVVGGLISAPAERARTRALIDQLGIVAATLDQPIAGLSGGNQQKAVLARSFLHDARVVLIDEPTQGVDANARFDIYRAIRAKADEGVACVINSSDAMELAGLCDRVLVFSRGRVIRELKGDDITEEAIVSAFLRARQAATAAGSATHGRRSNGLSLESLVGIVAGASAKWWLPLVLLSLLTLAVGAYASAQTDVFLTGLNIRHILFATAPLALVTIAQFNVLMVRGFDISVGSVMSLTVVVASFLIVGEIGPGLMALGSALCLLVGVIVGAANGVLVRYVGINPVITTIATLSVVQGVALYLRPSPLGAINDDFLDILKTRIGFAPVSFFVILAAAIAGDVWLYRTRSGLKLRAVGFREEAAKRNGVHIDIVHLRAYLLSGLVAGLAGLFLASEVGVGHPVVGSGYTLTSIAAAVLGGASLAGGRGSFVGAVLGALFFTLTINIITLLGLSTGAGIITSGALTLFAILLYSGWQPTRALLVSLRRAVRPQPNAASSR
jgi:ribose transport system permease protein/ribose transport system ATP-binding protein